MVNKRFWLGMLVLALVFGVFFISCDEGDNSDNVPIIDVLSQAISLSITQWEEGSVATGETKWYKFEAASGTTYKVQWADSYQQQEGSSYTGDIKVSALKSGGTITIFQNIDSGWINPQTVSEVSGTVYLKVEPYSSSAGTYAIRFYDPAIIVPQIPMTISSISSTPVPTVVVRWNSSLSTNGVTGYRVYRSDTETGSYTKIGSDITSYSTSLYNDTSVSAGNTYWYKIAAYNSVGEGDKSPAEQSDTVPDTSAVTSLTVGADITEGNLSTAQQVDWYTFTAVSGTTYKVQWAGKFGQPQGSTYTLDIKVSAFNSNGAPISTIQGLASTGWSYPGTVSGVSGTVYLKVEGYYASSTGTYGIKVYQE